MTCFEQRVSYDPHTGRPTRTHAVDGREVSAEAWRLAIRGCPLWLARLISAAYPWWRA